MNRDQEILEYLRGILSVEQEIKVKDNMIVFFTTYDGCFSLDKEHSICGNIWNSLSFYHNIDNDYFISWEYFSRETNYPVLGMDVYNATENFWIGKQLELRLDLVKHLVNCYEKVLGCY